MDVASRIENALEIAVSRAEVSPAPPLLASALRYAVFPGGARIRPRLCLSVARACGDDNSSVADAAAAAIEMLHCASLVHDDLPCFDDAATRRGKPSVHKAYGEPLAVLVGDAMIVLAFETIARGAACTPNRLGALLLTISRSVGMPFGITSGQAWECEPAVSLADYHRLKTGSLFAAATAAGAIASGANPDQWRTLGERLGEAFQIADDIHDTNSLPEEVGKPCGRDVHLGRPSAVDQLGLEGAVNRLEQLLGEAVASVPDCPGAVELRSQIVVEAKRFVPKGVSRRAA